MLDKWFLEDVAAGLQKSGLFIVLDEQNQSGFLLKLLKQEYANKVIVAANEIDELRAKYDIEKNHFGRDVVIFTTIPLDRLKFLREYCETRGRLQINHLHRYISQKVNEKACLDLGSEDADKIIAYGKKSIGKKTDFWDNVKIGAAITEEDVLRFLDNPDAVFNESDKEGQKLFTDFMSGYTLYSLVKKPPQTIANEIATSLFNNMVYRKDAPFLDKTYRKWLDSKRYEPALKKYASIYRLPSELDIWQIPAHHPFRDIDTQWLKQFCDNFSDKEWVRERLPAIKERAVQSVTNILDVGFWKDIYVLLSFEPAKIDGIHSIDDAMAHYKNDFYRIDNAIRHLYAVFISEKTILKPLQEYYQQIVQLYLDKWFKYFTAGYQENQTGLLKKIITENEPPIAIIVGDALSYEVAQEIAAGIGSGYKIERKLICSNYPSETGNNMSSLFVASGELFLTRDKRHAALLKDSKRPIEFMDLDDLSLTQCASDYTILYSADVDSMSDKQNLKALKYYGEIIAIIQAKIDMLFACGYKKVFIVSDHGFALTGILDESDKVELNIVAEKHERYGVSKEKLAVVPDQLVEIRKSYNGYDYLYFSRSLNPFKTKGAYGFAHGGITPQELLTPLLKIEKDWTDSNSLTVTISNKQELVNVVGDFYRVKCNAHTRTVDVFSYERKIQIVCVKGKEQFNEGDIITIQADEEIVKEFAFNKYDEFDILIVDAVTKARLDSCKVKRQIARDLGGLGGNL